MSKRINRWGRVSEREGGGEGKRDRERDRERGR